MLQKLSDLDFNLLRSLKVKYNGTVGLPICDFLFVFNSNTWPNPAHLREISLRNLSDLDLTFKVTQGQM